MSNTSLEITSEQNNLRKPNIVNFQNRIQLNKVNFLPFYEMSDMGDAGKFGVLDSDGNFDYDRVQQYMQVFLVLDKIVNGKKKTIMVNFRRCKKQDFFDNGYDKEINLNMNNLICPDTSWLGDDYDVFNSYSDK